MKLYVCLSKSPRGGGPGDERFDVPIEVTDKSDASFEAAREQAIKQFMAEKKINPQQVWHYGTY